MKKIQHKSPEISIGDEHHEPLATMGTSDSAMKVGLGTERDELIRQTAYSNYEARSYAEGYAEQDWLQAESTVNQMSV